MSNMHERIVQAEEGIEQIQRSLDHAQTALRVAEQVEVAATRSRRLLKMVLLAGIVGIVILVVMKVASRSTRPDLVLVDDEGADEETDPDGGPSAS
ncbi:MAG: hypothetical protein GY812_04745 [Actinomycetia bacterium]|nr:hypothetical protein [Actinomycetes bacterium]